MIEGLEKKNILSNNKVAPRNTPAAAPQASKPESFDNTLTNLLSSAAVDQAAEELYRRAQAQTDAVEAVARARVASNAPRYNNGPTNGNGVHPSTQPLDGAPVDPPVLSSEAFEQQRRDDYYQLHGGGLGLNDVNVNVADERD